MRIINKGKANSCEDPAFPESRTENNELSYYKADSINHVRFFCEKERKKDDPDTLD